MAQLTKHKWLIAIAAAVVIVLAVIWIALAQASKPDRVLEKFENAVKTKDTKQLEGVCVKFFSKGQMSGKKWEDALSFKCTLVGEYI
ncbi:hypothetical protein [Heyndrickxia coagulans]|uniref:hypothetical protein n=1 Tax=Heyndrickxia coagulans TaxID=1398 RepID=UPI0014152821|nr:hypothetical protein [Heyndrickxia coagulans]MBF8417910.1 hypothetical protein [Heyndrickxia coagulans]